MRAHRARRVRRTIPSACTGRKNSGPRRPWISRRTSPIARKCANFFRPRAALATAAAVVDAGERAVARRDEGERTRRDTRPRAAPTTRPFVGRERRRMPCARIAFSFDRARAGNVLPVGENSGVGGQRRRALAAASRCEPRRSLLRLREVAAPTDFVSKQAPRESGAAINRVAAARLAASRRPSPDLHVRTPASQAARPTLFAIAPIEPSTRARSSRHARRSRAQPGGEHAAATTGSICRDENRRSFSRFAKMRIGCRTRARCAAEKPRRVGARGWHLIESSTGRSESRAVGASRTPVRAPLPRSSARRHGARSFMVAVASARDARRCHFGFALRDRAMPPPAPARSGPRRPHPRAASPQTKRGASPGHRDRGPVLRSP